MKNVQYLLYNIHTKTVQKTYILDFAYIPNLTVLLTKDIETSLPNKIHVTLSIRALEGYTLYDNINDLQGFIIRMIILVFALHSVANSYRVYTGIHIYNFSIILVV